MKSLIQYWPREVATPLRLRPVIDTSEQFFKMVNYLNGIKNVYFSLYDCDKYSNFDNCIIDKVVYDFDDGKRSLQKIRDTIPLLKKSKLKYSIVFSGNKGFHLYIYTKPDKKIKNRHHVLFNAHHKIMKELNLIEEVDVDSKLIGDIKRIIRCPNTMHLKSRLYAIPLTAQEIETFSYRQIREIAQQPRLQFFIHGTKLFNLEGLDYTPKRAQFENIPDYNYNINLSADDEQIGKIIEKFHPCIKSWLAEPKNLCKNNSRWFFTVYCRDIGLPASIIDKIAKMFWSGTKDSTGIKSKYQEYKQENQLLYASKKQDYMMPGCSSLFQMGFCKGKCKSYKRDGFPIYH